MMANWKINRELQACLFRNRDEVCSTTADAYTTLYRRCPALLYRTRLLDTLWLVRKQVVWQVGASLWQLNLAKRLLNLQRGAQDQYMYSYFTCSPGSRRGGGDILLGQTVPC